MTNDTNSENLFLRARGLPEEQQDTLRTIITYVTQRFVEANATGDDSPECLMLLRVDGAITMIPVGTPLDSVQQLLLDAAAFLNFVIHADAPKRGEYN